MAEYIASIAGFAVILITGAVTGSRVYFATYFQNPQEDVSNRRIATTTTTKSDSQSSGKVKTIIVTDATSMVGREGPMQLLRSTTKRC